MAEKITDEQLVAKIQNNPNDTAAWNKLVKRYGEDIYSFLVRCLKDEDKALDLSQDVWERVQRKIDQFRLDGNFSAWIYTIAINLLKDSKRKEKGYKKLLGKFRQKIDINTGEELDISLARKDPNKSRKKRCPACNSTECPFNASECPKCGYEFINVNINDTNKGGLKILQDEPLDKVILIENREKIRKCIDELPEKQKKLFHVHKTGKFNNNKLIKMWAMKTGENEDAIKSRLRYAYIKIEECLRRDE